LQLNRHRFYHQQLGRWVSRDPLRYVEGSNLYCYADGRPVYSLDPLGLATTHKCSNGQSVNLNNLGGCKAKDLRNIGSAICSGIANTEHAWNVLLQYHDADLGMAGLPDSIRDCVLRELARFFDLTQPRAHNPEFKRIGRIIGGTREFLQYNKTYDVQCGGWSCPGKNAYTWKGRDFIVFCSPFLDKECDRFGTLIHEATHIGGGTSDEGGYISINDGRSRPRYGDGDNPPTLTTELALNNADTYAYFIIAFSKCKAKLAPLDSMYSYYQLDGK